MKTEPLKKAINIVGSQALLAKRLGVRQQNVSSWLKAVSGTPAEYCRGIEQATDGLVTRYDLRPDVFGYGPDRMN